MLTLFISLSFPFYTTHTTLTQKNHLSGLKRTLLKLNFWNVDNLAAVRRELSPAVARNKARGDDAPSHGNPRSRGRRSLGRCRWPPRPAAVATAEAACVAPWTFWSI
jgi:hypothetical protein